jgi:ATP-dependent Clp protease ATP-binding subunit ClpB
MEITSKPEELDEVDRKILQLEMERLSLKKKLTPPLWSAWSASKKSWPTSKSSRVPSNAQWQSEKDTIDHIQSIKEDIDQVNIEVQQAERDYDLNRAAELKYGKLTELQRQLETAETQLTATQTTGKTLLREEVTEEDIAENHLQVDRHSGQQAGAV